MTFSYSIPFPPRPRRVGDDLALPETFTARFEFENDHSVELEITVEDGAPLCRSIKVIRNATRGPLTGSELKRLPVANWVEYACSHAALVVRPGEVEGEWVMSPASMVDGPVPTPRRRTAITPAHLREVAAVYESAESNPTQAVRERFKASQRTASRWVQQARDGGYLPGVAR